MNINFNVYAPKNNKFLALKNQVCQKISFGQDYLDLYNSKKEKVKNDFYEIIMPEAKTELDNAEKEAYDASELYCNMLNNGTKILELGKDEIAMLSVRKNGLKKEKVIKVFKGRYLTKEISILSGKHYIVKKYSGNNEDYTDYDLYEYNYSNSSAKCARNVREVDSYYKYSYEAEKIYSYEGRNLTKYEEGYCFKSNYDGKQLFVNKCFEKLYNKEQRCRYLESASYSFNPITKTPKLQEHTAYMKF